MPVNSAASGTALTASFLNTNYRDQVVSTVTSGTRPSGTEGQVIYETDTDRFYAYSGAAWEEIGKLGGANTYTPTLTGSSVSPTLGSGSSAAGRYWKQGRMVTGWARIAFGSSGTAAGTGDYRISLPHTAINTLASAVIGQAYLLDSSTSAVGLPIPILEATTYMTFLYPAAYPTGTFTRVGAAAPWAWAASDTITVNFCYEAAA